MNSKISISNCEIGYKNKLVLSNINLNFKPGKIHLLIGENGSGKTTLIKTLAGAVSPLRGRVENVQPDSVSYLSTEFNFNEYQILGKEYIDLISAFNNFESNDFGEDLPLLSEANHSSMLELSSGMRQILRIKSMCSYGKNIILWDEPLKSLAIDIKAYIVNYLGDMSKEKIVIVTDHSIENWKEYNPIVFKISDGAIVKDT